MIIKQRKAVTTASTPALNLRIYQPVPTASSCIPEVRSGIRQQVKLLRSVSNAVLLLGIFAETILCFCMEPCGDAIGTLGAIALCVSGFAIALVALAIWAIIRMCISEIKEELKKLNGEV